MKQKPRPILIAALLILTAVVHAEPARQLLHSTEPVVFSKQQEGSVRFQAEHWSGNVYPIGNGRLGGTVFGEPKKERIQFNEDSMWVGNEDCTGGYQPFGDVYVEMPHEEFSEYFKRDWQVRGALRRCDQGNRRASG
jgi:alpha-L-fucosidase 2